MILQTVLYQEVDITIEEIIWVGFGQNDPLPIPGLSLEVYYRKLAKSYLLMPHINPILI
jgi:hypothetical protein